MVFSLQLYKSTLSGNKSLLSCYVRVINNGKNTSGTLICSLYGNCHQATLCIQRCEATMMKKNTNKKYFFCATDGRASTSMALSGFLAFLEREVLNATVIHCIVHHQHSVTTNITPRLSTSLSTVITVVNKTKSNPLNLRQSSVICALKMMKNFRGSYLTQRYDGFPKETVSLAASHSLTRSLNS